MSDKVLEALQNWILRVTDRNTPVTPEEVVVLPEVADIYLRYSGASRPSSVV